MASLTQHQSSTATKMLLLGDSGSGKTGALCSLAGVGYNLRILDLDNGLDVVKNILTDSTAPYGKDAASRVNFVTLTEKMKMVANKPVAVSANVWSRTMNLLSNWTDGEEKFGPVTTWGPNDILVVDSLTLLGTAAMNHILSLNGRLGQHPYQSDWGLAQSLLESLLQMLFSTELRCNVIMLCHITMMGESVTGADGKTLNDVGVRKGYPNALGRSLPRRIGQYFNTSLMVTTSGTGAGVRRNIVTTTNGTVDLKNSHPIKVKPSYPQATGLADYFLAVRGSHPSGLDTNMKPDPTAPQS